MSLAPVAKRLSELLGQEVRLSADSNWRRKHGWLRIRNPVTQVMLETLRFHAERKKRSLSDARNSRSLRSVHNDAFGTANRATHGRGDYSFVVTVGGIALLMERELHILGRRSSIRPAFVVILGGAKFRDKIGVIKKFAQVCDTNFDRRAMLHISEISRCRDRTLSGGDDSSNPARELMDKRENRSARWCCRRTNVVVDKKAWDGNPETNRLHRRECFL